MKCTSCGANMGQRANISAKEDGPLCYACVLGPPYSTRAIRMRRTMLRVTNVSLIWIGLFALVLGALVLRKFALSH